MSLFCGKGVSGSPISLRIRPDSLAWHSGCCGIWGLMNSSATFNACISRVVTCVLTSGPLYKLSIPFTLKAILPHFLLIWLSATHALALAQMSPLPVSLPGLDASFMRIPYHSIYHTIMSLLFLFALPCIKILAGVGWARLVFYLSFYP